MKCPKCGYLGFEAADRCKNCGYDFSLAVPAAVRDLPLRTTDFEEERPADLSLHLAAADPVPDPPFTLDDEPVAEPESSVDDAADDLPLFAPRPAGAPLAVRRPGTEVPRARRTTTRPVRMTPPTLPLAVEPATRTAPGSAEPTVPRRQARAEVAPVASRIAAAVVDVALLAAIDLTALFLTLRISGLEWTWSDLAAIRPVPMAGFFLVMAFLYLVGFTIGGGQTVGKMLLGIRVIGDDDQRVDLTGAVVRSLGALTSTCLAGALFVPALLSVDRRAVYDRLAGTRVVSA